MTRKPKSGGSASISQAILMAVRKLHPKTQLRNPVMFLVYVSSIVTTLLYGYDMAMGANMAGARPVVTLWVALWLWFTVLFANFAESIAEGRGKAQADSLRSLRKEVRAKKLKRADDHSNYDITSASLLRKDDLVFVEAGDFIPADGQVLDGIASVDESAITGESAPVIRESGGDSDAVTGGNERAMRKLLNDAGAGLDEYVEDRDELVARRLVVDLLALRAGDRVGRVLGDLLTGQK